MSDAVSRSIELAEAHEKARKIKHKAFVKAFWKNPDSDLFKIISGIYERECKDSRTVENLRNRTISYQYRVIVDATRMWDIYITVKGFLKEVADVEAKDAT